MTNRSAEVNKALAALTCLSNTPSKNPDARATPVPAFKKAFEKSSQPREAADPMAKSHSLRDILDAVDMVESSGASEGTCVANQAQAQGQVGQEIRPRRIKRPRAYSPPSSNRSNPQAARSGRGAQQPPAEARASTQRPSVVHKVSHPKYSTSKPVITVVNPGSAPSTSTRTASPPPPASDPLDTVAQCQPSEAAPLATPIINETSVLEATRQLQYTTAGILAENQRALRQLMQQAAGAGIKVEVPPALQGLLEGQPPAINLQPASLLASGLSAAMQVGPSKPAAGMDEAGSIEEVYAEQGPACSGPSPNQPHRAGSRGVHAGRAEPANSHRGKRTPSKAQGAAQWAEEGQQAGAQMLDDATAAAATVAHASLAQFALQHSQQVAAAAMLPALTSVQPMGFYSNTLLPLISTQGLTLQQAAAMAFAAASTSNSAEQQLLSEAGVLVQAGPALLQGASASTAAATMVPVTLLNSGCGMTFCQPGWLQGHDAATWLAPAGIVTVAGQQGGGVEAHEPDQSSPRQGGHSDANLQEADGHAHGVGHGGLVQAAGGVHDYEAVVMVKLGGAGLDAAGKGLRPGGMLHVAY